MQQETVAQLERRSGSRGKIKARLEDGDSEAALAASVHVYQAAAANTTSWCLKCPDSRTS